MQLKGHVTHNFKREKKKSQWDEKLDRDAVLSLNESTHSTFKKMPEMKIDAAVLLHILQIDFPYCNKFAITMPLNWNVLIYVYHELRRWV